MCTVAQLSAARQAWAAWQAALMSIGRGFVRLHPAHHSASYTRPKLPAAGAGQGTDQLRCTRWAFTVQHALSVYCCKHSLAHHLCGVTPWPIGRMMVSSLNGMDQKAVDVADRPRLLGLLADLALAFNAGTERSCMRKR